MEAELDTLQPSSAAVSFFDPFGLRTGGCALPGAKGRVSAILSIPKVVCIRVGR